VEQEDGVEWIKDASYQLISSIHSCVTSSMPPSPPVTSCPSTAVALALKALREHLRNGAKMFNCTFARQFIIC